MSHYAPHARRPPVYCSRCQGEIAAHRAPLTVKQARVLAVVADRIAATGVAPSFKEIAAACGYRGLATVHEHLGALERKGYLTREFNCARAITLVTAA